MSEYKELIKSIGPANRIVGDTNNCAVLALSAAFEIPYDEAHEFSQSKWNRKIGRGTKTKEILSTFNTKHLFGRDVIERSNKNQYVYKRSGKVVECTYKLGTFAKKMDKGTYYVLVNRHATVVKDGKILDGTAPGKIVNKVWQII